MELVFLTLAVVAIIAGFSLSARNMRKLGALDERLAVMERYSLVLDDVRERLYRGSNTDVSYLLNAFEFVIHGEDEDIHGTAAR